jgi:hypothetical protein
MQFLLIFLTIIRMLGDYGLQYKGKAAISNLASRLGLYLFGLLAADQLNLSTEQPQMSAFNFNLYGQTVLGWLDEYIEDQVH